jgi:hypothetical protein
MRADIHDDPEHNALQTEVGYIDARPHLPDRQKPLATHGRTIHRVKTGGVGSGRSLPVCPAKPTFRRALDFVDMGYKMTSDFRACSTSMA